MKSSLLTGSRYYLLTLKVRIQSGLIWKKMLDYYRVQRNLSFFTSLYMSASFFTIKIVASQLSLLLFLMAKIINSFQMLFLPVKRSDRI